MRNSATADLSSVTVRVRHFAGRTAAEIADEYPILPLDAPGLPPPGPSFRTYAAAIGDPSPAEPRKGKKKLPPEPPGPYLTALVRGALYVDMTGVRLTWGDETRVFYLQPGVAADGWPNQPQPCGEYGPKPCRLMVLGKCLGPTEESSRRPYSGRGSIPLWDAWREAGLPPPTAESPVFLTNLLRFSPPLSTLTRLPKEWVADGLHLVYQEIAQVRPEVLWVLGADALKALFGSKAKVDDYRGRVVDLAVDCRPTPGAPEDTHVVRVVTADHPAAVARDPDRAPLLVQSARLVAQTLGVAPSQATVPLDYRAIYTVGDLAREVEASCVASADGGYLAFDCEWEGGHPTDPGSYLYTVQWSHAPGHGRAVFLRRQGGAPNPQLPLEAAAPLLRDLFCGLRARGGRLVGHFAKADLPWLDSIGVDLYPHFIGPPEPVNPGDASIAERSYYMGAHDTYVGGHATDEAQVLKLEILAVNSYGAERWDIPMMAWRDEYCRANKLSRAKLKGYGNAPEEIITTYGCSDVDHSGRLYLHQNGDPRLGTPGTLDRDRFGNSCRQIFAIRMRAWAAWAEMERTGILVDVETHHRLRDVILEKRAELLACLRDGAQWNEVREGDEVLYPAFDPAKPRHRVEFLFGEQHLDCPSVRPPGALSLYLDPYKATDTTGGGKLWAAACDRNLRQELPPPKPAADKETLIHLARRHPLAALLRDIDFLGTATKILFRKADEPVGAENEEDLPTPGEEHHERGLLAELCGDGRVRSTFGFVETGRTSSSKPNCLVAGLAEYLTRRGWVPVEKLGQDDLVAQFDPGTGEVSFVKPLEIVVKPWDGDVVETRTLEQIRLTMTPDHRCLVRTRKAQRWLTVSPEDVKPDHHYFHAGTYSGGGASLTRDQVILLVAAQADGHWTKYGGVSFGFSKRRKIERLTSALRGLGVTWTSPKSGRAGATNFHLGTTTAAQTIAWLKGYLGETKELGPWLLDFDTTTRRLIADELFLWDGSETRRDEVYSSNKTTADWAQILYTTLGMRARMRVYHNSLPNAADHYIVGVPRDRSPYSMTTNIEHRRKHYQGTVHCVTVPTGYIVVREDGKVSVTGNCQNFSGTVDEQYDRILVWGKEAKKRLDKLLATNGFDPAQADDLRAAAKKKFVSRSLMRARPGWYLVNADLKGAEIAAAAWSSGDPLLIEHAARNTLKETDPNWLDLHSDLAKTAFGLTCTLAEVKENYKALRTAAKRARFGHYYGASPETILRQALEEAEDVTLEQIQAIVSAHDKKYPVLAAFFASCRQRVHTHGWLRNGQGGIRRFRRAADPDLLASQEREAQNWSCQGLVADVVNTALGHLIVELRRRRLQSRIVLSVHDSFMLECPPAEVPLVVDTLLPLCVTERSPVIPATLDGHRVARGPYHFDIDVEVCRAWGVDVPEAEWRAHAAA